MAPTITQAFDFAENAIRHDIDTGKESHMEAYLFNPEDKCSIVVMPDLNGSQAAAMTRLQCYEDHTEVVILCNGIWIAKLDELPEPWKGQLIRQEIEVRELPPELRSDGWMVYLETPDASFVMRQYELDATGTLVVHKESARAEGDFITHFYPLLPQNFCALARENATALGMTIPEEADAIMLRTLDRYMDHIRASLHRYRFGGKEAPDVISKGGA